MRGPSPQKILATPPPELRTQSRVTKAILDLREKILTGEYRPGQLLTVKTIKDVYGLNNIETQTALLRLAVEGLVQVQPVRERTGPNNAAINRYFVANFNVRDRMLSTRRGDFVSDVGHAASKDTLELEMQYADEEIASLLELKPGEPVIFHRNLQRRNDTVVAICDSYVPFWFASLMPEMNKPDFDLYQLMRQLGKNPTWCRETVDMVQASSVERELFGLSPDDPSGLFKILRRTFDDQGHPLEIQYLTDRGDVYRLDYSFPLFAEGIPEPFRDK
ncbi:hypothetical protein KSF_108670 [Reticulibacter mediterranei]|uniref:UbiC transcription regulator-associated domain-containing protein n=1 Tax=Reticulibacter mediterranei TaxID=2778369 RepID=A0A8J3IZG5_9CHLR|nr:GntR family transcriptional regulator [Reticulibacter mediterranei]GHP00820.1 hypothetical protein KSF_108670 [Reticulibacter mediterranei]